MSELRGMGWPEGAEDERRGKCPKCGKLLREDLLSRLIRCSNPQCEFQTSLRAARRFGTGPEALGKALSED